MSAAVRIVQNTLENPGPLKPLAGKRVSIRLNVPSFTSGGVTEKIRTSYATTDDTGTWSAELEVNADLDPTGTFYTVAEASGVIWTFIVPAGDYGTPVTLRECLVDAPSNSTPIIAGVSPAELSDAVDAAVSDVIAGAPGALDTLNELAAALGDDANFATTVTNALATKQPLDADLTAIAGLTTTSFGRGILALADAAALRTAGGLGTAATHPDTDFDAAGAASSAQSAAIAAAATDATTKANARRPRSSFAAATTTATSTLSAGVFEQVDATGGSRTRKLAAGAAVDDEITVKVTALTAPNTVTIQGDTGVTAPTLTPLDTVGQSVTLRWTGSAWVVSGRDTPPGFLDGHYARPKVVVRASGGDDSAALQTALNGAGWVHLPDPLYLFASGVVANVAGVKLTGGGWQGGTVLQATATMDNVIRVSQPRVAFADFDVNANNLANSGILLHNANRSEYARIDVYNCLADGWRFDLDATTPHGNNNIAKFWNCRARNNVGHGWAVPTRDTDHNGIEWHSCEANSNKKSGLLYKGSGGRIYGGIWQANNGFGIELGEDGSEGATTGVAIYHTWLEANGQFTGGAMTNGSPNLSTTTAAWNNPRHVGTTVNVPGAGVAGAALVAKVLTVTDSTHVVLDTNASTTVSGQLVNSPNNGIRASTQSNGCELHIGAGQQGNVGSDTFGKVFTVVLGANGEYDVIGTASRGVRLYGRSGATAKAQVIAAGPETDIRLELLGKGASGAMLGASAGAVGFFGTAPAAKPTITGTRSDGAAYANALTALAGLGLVTDSSTAGTGGSPISPTPVYKLTDTTFTSNITLADDPDLQVAVAANSVYLMECYLPYEAGTTGDGLIKFVGPTGATMIWSTNSLASNATVSTSATDRNKKSITQQVIVGGVGSGTGVECRPMGTLTVGSTAGTFKLQTAQSTSDATSTIFYAGGWLRLTKVA